MNQWANCIAPHRIAVKSAMDLILVSISRYLSPCFLTNLHTILYMPFDQFGLVRFGVCIVVVVLHLFQVFESTRALWSRSTYYLVANLEWFRWFLAGRKTVKKFSINTLFIVFIYSHSHEATNEQKTEVSIKLGSDLVKREWFGILIARWLSINIGCIALRRVNLYHLRKLSTLKFVRKTIFNLFEERAHAHIRLSASSSLWCRVSSALKKAFFVGLISMLSAKFLLLCCNVQHTEMH